MSANGLPRLSKSKFTKGLQCPKLLWWSVHEPDAPELVPDEAQQRVFARGTRVGELARSHVPGGVLIDLPYMQTRERVAATAAALAAGAPVIYEASFLEDGVFVSVDILERSGDGIALTEVKSTLDVKEPHLADVAIQLHVVRRAGLPVHRAEVMHLNRACRFPDLSNLFVREPVTEQLHALLLEAPAQIAALRGMLAGAIPDVATGAHCTAPYECPFLERCWPPLPDHHVSTLYRLQRARVETLLAQGCVTIRDLPSDFTASAAAMRQVRSVRAGERIVEPGLRSALETLRPPLAYLDFETVNPAIPVWPGCAPYDQIPVQFSCHVGNGEGAFAHHAWLADGPSDPRRALAEALLAACAGAQTVVAYHAPFEKRCIEMLADFLPDLASALRDLAARIEDLLPIVRNHVYHPEFNGGFGLKRVLPALCPGLGYDDLEIRGGDTAASSLEALLLDSDAYTDAERRALRNALLSYCERDTLAMVRLHEQLAAMAAAAEAARSPRQTPGRVNRGNEP
jgi:hypothetical protein